MAKDKKRTVRRYFNQASSDNIRDKLLIELNEISEKYNVFHLQYSYDINKREFLWKTEYFEECLIKAESIDNNKTWSNTLDNLFNEFKEIWLDRTIDRCEIMIWNLVYKTHMESWKETGIVPHAEGISKKLKKSAEGVAYFLADQEVNNFSKKFL